MSNVDFFHTLEIGGQQVEVNVIAHVTIGQCAGGPDPHEVDELTVKRLDNGKDITDELSEEIQEKLRDKAFDVAYDNATSGDDYDD